MPLHDVNLTWFGSIRNFKKKKNNQYRELETGWTKIEESYGLSVHGSFIERNHSKRLLNSYKF